MTRVRIKGAADCQSLGKNRGPGKHGAVGTFLVLQQGDLQTGLGKSNFLQIVEVVRLLQGAFMQDGVGQGEEATARSDLVGIGSRGKAFAGFQFGGDILPQLVHVDTGQVQLADLLLERHPGEKIVDAPFDWLIGLKISGDCGAGLRL